MTWLPLAEFEETVLAAAVRGRGPLRNHIGSVEGEECATAHEKGELLRIPFELASPDAHSKVQRFTNAQSRSIPQQNIQKLEMFDMPAKEHQTHRQGIGQKEPKRSPERRPKRRRDHNCNGRQSCAFSV